MSAQTPDHGCVVEICCDNIESVLQAATGGAQRIELCADLSNGGVTPSIGTVRVACEALGGQGCRDTMLHVLVRPRAGPFCYSASEWQCILADVAAVRDVGADGVVVGALTESGQIDHDRMRELVASARPLAVTFHRAFDVAQPTGCQACGVAAAVAMLHELRTLEIDFVLTSGCAQSACDGQAVIKALVKESAYLTPEGRQLTVIAGAGVSGSNAVELMNTTGVQQLHAASSVAADRVVGGETGGAVAMGAGSAGRENVFKCVLSESVRTLVRTVADQFSVSVDLD